MGCDEQGRPVILTLQQRIIFESKDHRPWYPLGFVRYYLRMSFFCKN